MSLLFLSTVISFLGKDHIKEWLKCDNSSLKLEKDELTLTPTESITSINTLISVKKTFIKRKISNVLYFYDFFNNDDVYCSVLLNIITKELTCEFTEENMPDDTYCDICKYIIETIIANNSSNKLIAFNVMKSDNIMSNYFGSKGYSKFKGPYLFYYCDAQSLLA